MKSSQSVLLEKARAHFRSVLKDVFDEPAFILTEDDDSIIPGASVTAVLYLSRFVDMFGDLVDKEDYTVDSFNKLNGERDFQIGESVFTRWKEAGCLM